MWKMQLGKVVGLNRIYLRMVWLFLSNNRARYPE